MPDPLDDILERLRSGALAPSEARRALATLRAQPLGFATIDHDRKRRCGVAEVVYAAGKSAAELVEIVRALLGRERCVLVTRAEAEHREALGEAFTDIPIESGTRGGTLVVGTPPKPAEGLTAIPIITAGTSDLPVAEEALLTCKALGHRAAAINDVGVAGLHRLEPHLPVLRRASVVVCIAGMEGALPSVIGGLIEAPVIAVPTSVGYGASFAGVTALLSMLTSCASGVTVVNIDNGFGAAYSACLVNRLGRGRVEATGQDENEDENEGEGG
jgi:pyridinium-3,5-biscarboxylic acid mononucleotide synthase